MRVQTSLVVLMFAVCVAVSAQQAPDRSHPPQPGPPPALRLPDIQKRQLANGLLTRIEYRRDVSNVASFASDEGPKTSQGSFGIGVLYTVTSKR